MLQSVSWSCKRYQFQSRCVSLQLYTWSQLKPKSFINLWLYSFHICWTSIDNNCTLCLSLKSFQSSYANHEVQYFQIIRRQGFGHLYQSTDWVSWNVVWHNMYTHIHTLHYMHNPINTYAHKHTKWYYCTIAEWTKYRLPYPTRENQIL